MELESLKLIGLTTSEIKIYLTLLEKGKLKASEIVTETGVASSKIYELLESMQKKGIIQIIPEKVNYYIAKSFEHVEELINKKQKDLEKLKNKLKEYKELSKKRNNEGIFIARGKKNFYKVLKELKNIRTKKTYGYAIKWNFDILNLNVMKSVRENIKKGVKYKVLYDYDAPKEDLKKWNKIIPNYNFIKNKGIAMDISDDGVFISIEELDSTMYIKSSDLAEVLKQLFEGYYENQK